MPFNFTNNSDRALFEEVFKEAVDIFGIDIEYWVVEFDETKEELYAEDSKPLITEKYDMKAYGEYIQEEFLLTKFGLQSSDIFEIVLSKTKFEETVGDNAEPKSGDRVYVNYMDRIFTVAEAKEEDNIYLQRKYSWKLVLNPTDFNGTEVTENIGVPDYEEESPLFDDNDLIDELDDDVVVEKEGDTNPWGDFE